MATLRVCFCPCGHMSVQEAEAEPACYKCGEVGDNIDWMNIESSYLREDLDYVNEVLRGFEEREQVSG